VVILWVAAAIGFAGTAFRVDEPNILAIARQIVVHPADPYGFSINWLGHLEPAAKILANPPLVPYWLALWGGAFEWQEVPLHLSMLPFGIVALCAMASLARRWGLSPGLAAALLLASPGFFVGSQVVMPDVAMLSMLLLTMAAALKWLDDGTNGALATMIAAAAVTPLLKYNGVIVVPLLVILAIAHARKREGFVVAALAPVAALAGWALLSKAMYGQSHFGASAQLQKINGFGDVMTGALAVIGLGVLPLPLALFPRAAAIRRSWDLGLSSAVAVISFLAALTVLAYPVISALLFALAYTIAVRFLFFSLVSGVGAIAARDWRTLFLVTWIAATCALQTRLMFTSVRYLLPLLPAAILLLMPRSRVAAKVGERSRTAFATMAASLVLVFGVALGDAETANVARSVVRDVVRPAAARTHGRLLFAGHWGFQWYMEQLGGVAIEAGERPLLRGGDLLAVAHTPFPQIDSGPTGDDVVDLSTSYSIGIPIHTIDCWADASFYSNGIGRCRRPVSVAYLPWGISSEPVEELDLYSVAVDRSRTPSPSGATVERRRSSAVAPGSARRVLGKGNSKTSGGRQP
jgi:4-amino-4-deoxy-L-arabinose transferase-like glycosyltransferase